MTPVRRRPPPPSTRTLYVAEPAAAWARRAPIVVDCSVIAALLFDEPAAEDAARMVSGRNLHAPSLLTYEIADVARRKHRAGLPLADAQAALTEFAEQRWELSPAPIAQVFGLAMRYTLSAYDAAYLWLAAELRSPLATFDRKLGEAARQHLGALD
jgi:predicted nucleic acid-binding protein